MLIIPLCKSETYLSFAAFIFCHCYQCCSIFLYFKCFRYCVTLYKYDVMHHTLLFYTVFCNPFQGCKIMYWGARLNDRSHVRSGGSVSHRGLLSNNIDLYICLLIVVM